MPPTPTQVPPEDEHADFIVGGSESTKAPSESNPEGLSEDFVLFEAGQPPGSPLGLDPRGALLLPPSAET